MAIYHCSIKSGSKGSGASAKSKSDYISREGKYSDKPDLEFKESGNMPKWAQADPSTFWKATDRNERENGRVWTEIEIALPRELSRESRKELVQGFIIEQLQGQPYTVAIHNPAAEDGKAQPHAHIIFSERKLDGIERDKKQFFRRANAKEPSKGGCAKDRSWNDRGKVQQIREAWERHHNKAVRWEEDHVSCKSLAAQGIDREPEPKIGRNSARAEQVKEARQDRKELQEINREMYSLFREIEEAKDKILDVVVQPEPPKPEPLPPPKIEVAKKQEVTPPPETTRCEDLEEFQDKTADTISSPLWLKWLKELQDLLRQYNRDGYIDAHYDRLYKLIESHYKSAPPEGKGKKLDLDNETLDGKPISLLIMKEQERLGIRQPQQRKR